MELVQSITKPFHPAMESVTNFINARCRGLEPWQVVLYTGGTTLALVAVHDFLNREESIKKRSIKFFFRMVRKIPQIRKKIDEEISKSSAILHESLIKDYKGLECIQALPRDGNSAEEVYKMLEDYQALAQADWNNGCVSGAVYNGQPALTEFITKVYGMFAWTNPLHPEMFPDIRKMEAEVIRMACTMFHGGPDTCGSMTAGGTESILLACLAYRNQAIERGVKYPEIIAPKTIHAAFDKAASLFKMKITHIPVDKDTLTVDINAMRRAINKNTCMLVGSAPNFPYGTVDSIEEISQLGVQYNIPVHVDACLGGFLVAFMPKAGFPMKPIDFRLPGVTSISADTHKYGFAPKGSSVVVYRSKKIRRYQVFIQSEWPGGVYCTPSIAGSRSGAVIAATWATMMKYGEQGYVDTTRKIIDVLHYIEKGLNNIKGLYVFGKPEISVVSFGSNDCNVFRIADEMSKRGWYLCLLQYPSAIHLAITLIHTKEGVADRFLKDVRECTETILNDPNGETTGRAALYGLSQTIPDRSLVADIAYMFIDTMYDTENEKKPALNGV